LKRIWRRWRRPIVFWGRLLALALVVALLWRPVERWVGQYRIERKLRIAEDALRSGHETKARDYSLDALRNDGDPARAFAVLLPSIERVGSDRAIDLAAAAIGSPEIAEDLRRRAWEIVCREAPVARLLGLWFTLDGGERAREEWILPMARRLLEEGAGGRAVAVLGELGEPLSPEAEESRLRAWLQRGDPEALRRFVFELCRLLEDQPADAERWGAVFDELPQAALDEIRARAVFLTLPEPRGVEPAAAWRRARCRIVFDPGQAAAILEETLARVGPADPPLAADWCLRLGRPDRAMEWFGEPEPALEAGEFERQWRVLEAAAELERQIEFLTEASEQPSRPRWQARLFEAKASALVGGKRAADASATQALQLAIEHTDSGLVPRFAREAARLGLVEIAFEAWTAALVRGEGRLPLADDLMPVVERLMQEDRERELMGALVTLRRLEPGNPTVAVLHGYLACLHGFMEPSTLVDKLEAMEAGGNVTLPLISTLTFAYVLAGDAERAVLLSDALDADWFALPVRHRAIRAVALDDVGRAEEAEVFLEDFPWELLMPTEERVMKDLLLHY